MPSRFLIGGEMMKFDNYTDSHIEVIWEVSDDFVEVGCFRCGYREKINAEPYEVLKSVLKGGRNVFNSGHWFKDGEVLYCRCGCMH